jgi:hypothetical protein
MRVVTEMPCVSENLITIALQYRLADSLEGLLKSAYYIQYDTVHMKHQDHTLSTEPWLVDVACPVNVLLLLLLLLLQLLT